MTSFHGIVGFTEYLIGRGASRQTIRNYERWVDLAESWLIGRSTSLAWASASQIREFAEANIPATYSSRQQASSAFAQYWNWKERADPPSRAVRIPPRPEMVCRAVEPEEATRLVATASGWWPHGIAVLFGLYLALRTAEIAKAEWSRFSDGDAWYRVTGKYGKTATLPVHDHLREEIDGRRNGSAWVFPGRFGGPVNPATIWSWSKEVATAAGIESFTTHQLRHTSLATANDRLGDLRAVQTFARHSKPSTTAGYTRTTRRRLRDVSDSLDFGPLGP